MDIDESRSSLKSFLDLVLSDDEVSTASPLEMLNASVVAAEKAYFNSVQNLKRIKSEQQRLEKEQQRLVQLLDVAHRKSLLARHQLLKTRKAFQNFELGWDSNSTDVDVQ